MNHLLIYGAGVSGIAAARLARHLDIPIWIYDDHRELGELPLELRSAFIADLPHLTSLISEHPCTLIPSPGIPPATYAQLAQHCRAGVLSEVDFGLNHLEGRPILAITGTNGKSTCCAMIQYLFEQVQIPLKIMGNFGVPVSERALEAAANGPELGYILELSSYQLAQSQQLGFPVAMITNIHADHLERHRSLPAYIATKWRLSTHAQQPARTYLITPPQVLEHIHHHELPLPEHQLIITAGESSSAGLRPMSCDHELKQLASWGCRYFARHLRSRLKTHPGLDHLAGMDIAQLTQRLENFPGLPHRLEQLTPASQDGSCTYINDAKSTNLSATTYAIAALAPQQPRTLLILGGIPKSAPDKTTAARLNIPPWVLWVAIIGTHAQAILATLTHSAGTHLSTAATLSQLLQPAASFRQQLKERGIECVLFSPSGSSLDQYPHYAARGDDFKRLVQELTHPRC